MKKQLSRAKEYKVRVDNELAKVVWPDESKSNIGFFPIRFHCFTRHN